MSRALWLARGKPVADAGIGIGVFGDVADDGDGIRAGSEDFGSLFELDAADGDQRDFTDALFPFGDARHALRRKAHGLERGREDRAERDVVGLVLERVAKLGVVVGREAERQPGGADRLDVGVGEGREVLLAEMQVLGFRFDRCLPVIVDHEPGRGAAGGGQRFAHELERVGLVQVLRAQLDRADAEAGEAFQPRDQSTTG